MKKLFLVFLLAFSFCFAQDVEQFEYAFLQLNISKSEPSFILLDSPGLRFVEGDDNGYKSFQTFINFLTNNAEYYDLQTPVMLSYMKTLNLLGADGWQVIDISKGNFYEEIDQEIILMRDKQADAYDVRFCCSREDKQ